MNKVVTNKIYENEKPYLMKRIQLFILTLVSWFLIMNNLYAQSGDSFIVPGTLWARGISLGDTIPIGLNNSAAKRFSPTQADIKLAEQIAKDSIAKRIEEYELKNLPYPYTLGTLRKLNWRPRQYFGTIEGGDRILVINLLIVRPIPLPVWICFPSWKEHIYIKFFEGYAYTYNYSVQINLTRKSLE